jgi:serine/threonine-protein kinase
VTEVIYQIVHVSPPRIDKHRADLPHPLIDAIHRAIEKDPTRRFATAAELGAAIRPYANRPSLPAPARIETDDTVASAEESLRRQANTSQLGATALPPSEQPARPIWRWLAVGIVALGALSWVGAMWFQRTARSDAATAAAGSAPIAVASSRGVGSSALLTSASVNLAASPSGVASDAAAPANSQGAELLRTGHGATSDTSNTATSRSNSVKAPEVPSAEPSSPIASAPHEPPVSPPPVAPKATHRANTNDGVPITIDTSNPF